MPASKSCKNPRAMLSGIPEKASKKIEESRKKFEEKIEELESDSKEEQKNILINAGLDIAKKLLSCLPNDVIDAFRDVYNEDDDWYIVQIEDKGTISFYMSYDSGSKDKVRVSITVDFTESEMEMEIDDMKGYLASDVEVALAFYDKVKDKTKEEMKDLIWKSRGYINPTLIK